MFSPDTVQYRLALQVLVPELQYYLHMLNHCLDTEGYQKLAWFHSGAGVNSLFLFCLLLFGCDRFILALLLTHLPFVS